MPAEDAAQLTPRSFSSKDMILSVLVTAVLSGLGVGGGERLLAEKKIEPLSKETLVAAESRLMAAMAEGRAKAAEAAADQARQLATLLAKGEERDRRQASLEEDVKVLEGRTGSRFTREDGEKAKAQQAAVDRAQDERMKEFDARLRAHESLPWHPRAGAAALDEDRRLTAIEQRQTETEKRLSVVESDRR